MSKSTETPHKKCALCFTQKPLTQFISISKAKSEKKIYGTVCSSCLGIDSNKFHLHSFQKKLKRLFHKLNNKAGIFDKNKKPQKDEDDEGGSGGKQLQQAKDVETLAKQIELANERARLAEENLTDQKQKKIFKKHKLDLTKRPEEENKHKDSADALDSDLEKERKKEKARKTQNNEQDETDAIAGKVQRDISGTRSSDRAAKFGGLRLGFGFNQQPSPQSTAKINKSSTENSNTTQAQQSSEPESRAKTKTEANKTQTNKENSTTANPATHTEKNQQTKTELQKTASLLFNTQQAAPNQNAPAQASVSNRVASPSEAASNLFSHKNSGQQQATQQQNARNAQSTEAGTKVSEELATALRATQARWGK